MTTDSEQHHGRRRRRRADNFIADCPNLQAYLQRISAVQRNFRKFEVEEAIDDRGRGRYRRVVATITIAGDDSDDSNASLILQCSNPDYAPTPDEAAAIAPEIENLQFPRSVHARDIDNLLATLPGVDPDDLFSFRGKNGGVMFVQQRKETNEGKAYLPWSYWSDGEWRMMEPDGLLPLYGLDRLNAWPAVLICEGPKTARAVQRLLADGKDHPWIGDLKDYVPIGWPGGTERWSAVDWQPLANLPPGIRVVVACDNDAQGKNVMTKIARLLQRHSIRALMPDDRWPLNWDLADPFPNHKKWWRGKKYVGPSFASCLFPATWATKPVKVPGADKPAYVITERFAAEWLYVVEIDSFVHRQHVDRAWSRKQFDARIKAFSDVKDTAVKFMALEASKVEALAYEPDELPGVINVDGERKLNTFRPTTITPVAGNPWPFLRFMTHLIPSKVERRETLRWMTTVVCRPDIRVLYALLLISKMQGVGKTTLALIAANLVGMHNTSFPSEKDVTKSTFNTFIAHRRLAVIHEIYSGERRKAYDTIKSWITEKHVDCNKKFVTPYTISNWCHFIATSNSLLAIHLDDEDRRFFVPRITEKKLSRGYWNRFYGWLNDDGYGIILNYLHRLAARPQWIVGPGEHAPTSPVKDEIIAEARSPGQQLAHALATIARRRMETAMTIASTMTDPEEKKKLIDDAKVVFVMPQVHLWMTSMRQSRSTDQRLEKELTLRRAMVAAGLRDSPVGPDGRRRRYNATFKYGEAEPTYPVYVVSNFDIPAAHIRWEDIKAHHRTPDDVWSTRPVAGGAGGDGWRSHPHMPPQ
jgi:hypothetical protein